tara:strand:- start:60 stop:293 length:234 start_codon:yes stop_codon:yes gene_type:complete
VIKIFLILAFLFTNGCAIMVAKETAKVLDTVLEEKPNPTKKEKILENKKKKKESLNNRAKEFYCSKVKDKEKCEGVQ